MALSLNLKTVIATGLVPEEEYTHMYSAVAQIIRWAKLHHISAEDNVLVHCHAGISRSSAIAWVLKVMQGEDYHSAFSSLQRARPEIWPNLLVIQMADRVLNLGGTFSVIAADMDEQIRDERQAKWETSRVQWKRGEMSL